MLREDTKRNNERDKNEFKNLLFAHAFATQNRELFLALYPEHEEQINARNADEWIVPKSIEDLEKMMAEFNVQSIH